MSGSTFDPAGFGGAVLGAGTVLYEVRELIAEGDADITAGRNVEFTTVEDMTNRTVKRGMARLAEKKGAGKQKTDSGL